MTRNQESTDDAYTEGNAVSIAPKVSGYVVDNRINDNLVVHAGDLLLKIDPRDYIAAGDQARAIAAGDQARANLDSALAQLASAENDLEITRVRAPAKPLPQTPPIIGVGVPSTLARRRPDIRQAEAQLHAATAGVGVAVADFYPDISLTGNLGVRALDASYLTKWASLFYSVGPSISLPIFQGSRLTAGLRLARAQTEEVALHYRGTVLNGLREVEDALVAYRADRMARDRQADTVRSAELTLYLARNQYSNGLSAFIQVLDAERTLESQRQQLVQADVQLVNDVVALYRALGGGWEQSAGDVKVSSGRNCRRSRRPHWIAWLRQPRRPGVEGGSHGQPYRRLRHDRRLQDCRTCWPRRQHRLAVLAAV